MRRRTLPALLSVLACSTQLNAQILPVPLQYNFNGIVHAGEAGQPDNPNGFRSISDRALDFSAGIPVDALLAPYQIVATAGALDIVHLGNRNTVAQGIWAFDPVPDSNSVGIQPAWLANPDQSMQQVTVLATPIAISGTCSFNVLFQMSDGGGTFDVTFTFASNVTYTATLVGPDWYGGRFPGTQSVDAAVAGGGLSITEGRIDLSSYIGDMITSVAFENRTNLNGACAILAANLEHLFVGGRGLGAPLVIGNTGSHIVDVESRVVPHTDRCLGVSVDPTGTIWVSGSLGGAQGPHKLFEFDANGNFVSAYDQPTATWASAWGVRDLAWDGDYSSNSRIYAACEHSITGNQIFAWDWTNRSWDYSRTITLPGTGHATVGRALAVCPPGHPAVQAAFPGATTGVLVHCDFTAPIDWIDIASGAVIARTVNPAGGVYGAYFDASAGTVTLFSQNGGPRTTDQVVFVTVDLAGQPTGQAFLGDLSVRPSPSIPPGGIAGGAEWNLNLTTGRGEVTYLAQALSDSVVRLEADFHYGSPGCLGGNHGSSGFSYGGNASYAVSLDGLSVGSVPVLGLSLLRGATVNPVPSVLNCGLDLHLGFLFALGPYAVMSGQAHAPLPLTHAPVGLSVMTQWAVLDLSGRVNMSRAGATFVHL